MEIRIFYGLIFLLIISAGTVFAQEPPVTVQTDDNNYDQGDTIVISGKVAIPIEGVPVVLQLFSGNNMIQIAQKTVAQDGTYTHTILAEGPLWKNAATILVRATYEVGGGNIAETEFSFTPKSESIETTNNFEVPVEGYGTFDVEYTIKGGTVKNIIVIPKDFAIIVQIESTDEGTISLDLPRELTHADTQDGENDTFLVFIDGAEIAHQETLKPDSKILTINFEEGDSDIEIIGTYVIPEFGTIAMIILIVGIMTIVLASRNKFQIKI